MFFSRLYKAVPKETCMNTQPKTVDSELLKILDRELQRLTQLLEASKDEKTKSFATERIKVIQTKLLDYLDCPSPKK
jgi:hypothetical protein